MHPRRWLVSVGLFCLVAGLVGAFPAGGAGQRSAVEAGREVYFRKCASCHGEAGTGWGPGSRALRQRPTDLTALSNRKQPFDRRSIGAGITGRIRLEHPIGLDDMPHWRGSLEARVEAAGGITELDALLTYLETIQSEPYGSAVSASAETSARAGASLFAVHCSGCHGPDGRGTPAPTDPATPPVPDLTTMAVRGGGRLDTRHLFETIANGSHEHSEMPAWDRTLQKAGWPAVITTTNIAAIAAYVESIQRR